MFVKFVGAASLLLKFMNASIRFVFFVVGFFDRILCKLPGSGMVIFSVISSLPSAFRGLGFNFTAVRFTLPFESNNVFQIRHFGVIC
ncbi:hypothetical protein CEJ46_16675 [Vibrio anguillarum]|nr:hypothetical protein CEG15_16140 [Vibrio anguillarum]ASG05443.1 hypothetical protein CEJ46_16675 [Vibrio anguillarum]